MAEQPFPSADPVLKRAKRAAAGVVAALLLGAVVVLILRSFQARDLEAATTLHARQYVKTVLARESGGGQVITLPGTLQGIYESTVYARTNGYVLRWYKDIGSSVMKGDLLAEITAPEVEQQLSQALAAQVQTVASADLAKTTADRWRTLRQKDAVTEQDLDERVSAYKQAKANVEAADANVGRLRKLVEFDRVVAPFSGVVTRRTIDVGDLVNAGNGGAGQALFSVAQVDPLRLYVYVPQMYARQIKIGDPVTVVPDRIGAQYRGTIARTARAIDAATRTLQVEIRVPNPTEELIAGSYVQVMLRVDDDASVLVVPTNVLLFRPEGVLVPVVGAAGRVHLSPVKLGTDFGAEVEVLSGLNATDRIVANPGDSLAEGDGVTVDVQPDKLP